MGDKASAWRTFAIGLPSILIAKKWAEVEQGRALKIHKDKGGLHGSNWKVAGVVLMALMFLFVSAVGYVVAIEPEFQSLQFGKSNVYYMAPVQESEARVMGESLQKAEVFGADSGADAVLLKQDEHFVVQFVMSDVAWKTTEVDEYYSEVRTLLRETLQDPQPQLDYVDPELVVKKRLK